MLTKKLSQTVDLVTDISDPKLVFINGLWRGKTPSVIFLQAIVLSPCSRIGLAHTAIMY
jgi:hypothetical protein